MLPTDNLLKVLRERHRPGQGGAKSTELVLLPPSVGWNGWCEQGKSSGPGRAGRRAMRSSKRLNEWCERRE